MTGISPYRHCRMIGVTAAWLAMWCQIVLVAAMPLGPLAVAIDPLGNVPICHAEADGGAGQPVPQQPGHANHDCVLCTLCQAQAWPVAVLSSPPALPEQQAVAIVRLDAARPRAPPLHLTFAAQPRGPPPLI